MGGDNRQKKRKQVLRDKRSWIEQWIISQIDSRKRGKFKSKEEKVDHNKWDWKGCCEYIDVPLEWEETVMKFFEKNIQRKSDEDSSENKVSMWHFVLPSCL